MAKCDITVSRGLTINTGNYGSIRPDISITLKDIDSSTIDEIFGKMQQKLDAMLALEVISLGNEAQAINDMSFMSYKKELEKSQNKIEKSLKEIKL